MRCGWACVLGMVSMMALAAACKSSRESLKARAIAGNAAAFEELVTRFNAVPPGPESEGTLAAITTVGAKHAPALARAVIAAPAANTTKLLSALRDLPQGLDRTRALIHVYREHPDTAVVNDCRGDLLQIDSPSLWITVGAVMVKDKDDPAVLRDFLERLAREGTAPAGDEDRAVFVTLRDGLAHATDKVDPTGGVVSESNPRNFSIRIVAKHGSDDDARAAERSLKQDADRRRLVHELLATGRKQLVHKLVPKPAPADFTALGQALTRVLHTADKTAAQQLFTEVGQQLSRLWFGLRIHGCVNGHVAERASLDGQLVAFRRRAIDAHIKLVDATTPKTPGAAMDAKGLMQRLHMEALIDQAENVQQALDKPPCTGP